MTDLEMTKLCAKAMGYTTDPESPFPLWESRTQPTAIAVGLPQDPFPRRYNPLRDDEQAMALVKRFHLTCATMTWHVDEANKDREWFVTHTGIKSFISNTWPDLNRAIVECVAMKKSANSPAHQETPHAAEHEEAKAK